MRQRWGESAKFAKAVDAGTGARHTSHLMTKRAQCTHEWKAYRTSGASNEYFHDETPLIAHRRERLARYVSSAACGVLRKLIAIRL